MLTFFLIMKVLMMKKVELSKRLIKNIYGNNFLSISYFIYYKLKLKCPTNGFNFIQDILPMMKVELSKPLIKNNYRNDFFSIGSFIYYKTQTEMCYK